MVVVPLLATAISYGMLRQEVKDVRARTEKLEETAKAATEAKHGVDLALGEVRSFRTEAELRHQIVTAEIQHSNQLWDERFKGLQQLARTSRTARS